MRVPWPEIGGLAFAVVVGAAVVEPQPVLAPGKSALAAGYLSSFVATLETVALRRLRRALLQHLLRRPDLHDPYILVAPGVPEVPDTGPPGCLFGNGSALIMMLVMMMIIMA